MTVAGSSVPDVPDVEVETPDRRWHFDTEFFTSRWQCIWNAGCRGMHVTQDPARLDGCCTEGAALTDAEDFMIVARAAARLTPDVWQHAGTARRIGWFKRLPNGVVGTRVVGHGCIFLNRPGFPAGPGCALHAESLRRDERPIDGKPNICWQFPLRRTDGVDPDGRPSSRLHPWRSSDWKAAGGERSWFCTSAQEAFGAASRVWQSLRDELVEIVGPDVWDELDRRLRARVGR